MLNAKNLTEEGGAANASADTQQFFVDKAHKQSATDAFSKQMPWHAIEEVSRKTNDGTGAPSTFANANDITNLQTQTLVNHTDINSVTAEEFGYFLDGTKNSIKNWDTGEPKGDKHFV